MEKMCLTIVQLLMIPKTWWTIYLVVGNRTWFAFHQFNGSSQDFGIKTNFKSKIDCISPIIKYKQT
jgi:hypothetical protein